VERRVEQRAGARIQPSLDVALDGVPDDATDALAVAIGCAYRGVATIKLAAAR
jgi:Holliday junction resolvasome RuvABC endonuclease subunit